LPLIGNAGAGPLFLTFEQKRRKGVLVFVAEHLSPGTRFDRVMAGHSRSKNGVALLAYVPAIPIPVARRCLIHRDARHKAGHDGPKIFVTDT
jgi:hypothetical protein